MRGLILIFVFAIFPATALGDEPESKRSIAAIERVKTDLQRDLTAKQLSYGAPVFIQVTKVPAELTVHIQTNDGTFEPFRSYPICSYSGGLGPKKREGDGKSPEGFYTVHSDQMNPNSSYHLSFNLGFPNAYDRAKGYTGSYLMVHGRCVSIGCYAMTDPAMDEIWALMTAAFERGQREIHVHIFPYMMNWPMSSALTDSADKAFWRELVPAWQLFAEQKIPPDISVASGQYNIQPGKQ